MATKSDKYNIERMIKKIHEYTDNSSLPILKECALQNEWDYQYLMDLQRKNTILRREIVRLLTKKEVQLEKALATGQNTTAFIFMLKQLGWRDSPEQMIVNNVVQDNTGGNRSDALKKVDAKTLEQLDGIYKEIEKQKTKEQAKTIQNTKSKRVANA